jgi:hypothetical protein
MTRPNWRDPGAYGGLRPLDAPGFAWEFLRRNSLFVEELRLLKRVARRRTLTRAETELFALRWGVRFRWAQRFGRQSSRALDDCGAA